jgi:ATP-binding protein involved in chromosome partitioning
MTMRIAVPVTNSRVADHFGHCERFALFDVDAANRSACAASEVEAPEHQPGLLPGWLKQHGVTVVIARAMGNRAHSLFKENGIEVVVGAQHDHVKETAELYLAGTLPLGPNGCDH